MTKMVGGEGSGVGVVEVGAGVVEVGDMGVRDCDMDVWGRPAAGLGARDSTACSRGWIWRPWKNLTGPVTRTRSPTCNVRSSQGWPGHEQVTTPVSSRSTAWKMRSPDLVGTMPLFATVPTAVTSIPTSTRARGVMVEASS